MNNTEASRKQMRERERKEEVNKVTKGGEKSGVKDEVWRGRRRLLGWSVEVVRRKFECRERSTSERRRSEARRRREGMRENGREWWRTVVGGGERLGSRGGRFLVELEL